MTTAVGGTAMLASSLKWLAQEDYGLYPLHYILKITRIAHSLCDVHAGMGQVFINPKNLMAIFIMDIYHLYQWFLAGYPMA